MRKHAGFTLATMTIALATILWGRSAIIANHAEHIRPAVGFATHVMSNSYLPIQELDAAY